MWRIIPTIPLCMEIASEFIEIIRDAVRLMGDDGSFPETGVKREPAHERKFPGICKHRKIRLTQPLRAIARLDWQVWQQLACIAEHRMTARMAVLDIKNRIVARLLDHLEEVEIEDRVVASIKHHEANGVAADFVDDLAKRDQLTGALRHFD